jgi:hypothetical protein
VPGSLNWTAKPSPVSVSAAGPPSKVTLWGAFPSRDHRIAPPVPTSATRGEKQLSPTATHPVSSWGGPA